MEQCFDILEIVELARLPADDPRRLHLDVCPRCRGLIEAHGLFLNPGNTSDLDELASADEELQRRLDRALAVIPAATRSRRRQRTWFALAAILALCALGLTSAELLRLRDKVMPRVGENLRGGSGAGSVVYEVDGEHARVTWPAAPSADVFVFIFTDHRLTEQDRHVEFKPRLELSLAGLSEAAVFCQILAVSQGDTIARSDIIRTHPVRD